MTDRQNLVSGAAPIAGAGQDLESGQLGQMAGPPSEPVTQNIFQKSSHPVALFFHLCFRVAALLTYILCSLFTEGFTLPFVLVVLLLAFDFWTVKNVTGRLLVGLRWWNDIKEDGTSEWRFESQQNRLVNGTDSRVFWYSLYITPGIWLILSITAVFQLKLGWLLLTVIGMVMGVTNVLGYTKCEKDAKAKVTNFIAGQSVVQGFVGNMISNRFGSLFGGGAAAPSAAPAR
ncbi:hypothetical protein DFS34DRAFT_613207 [Phlyctochytrium arcticum]|nr:hypothetical protein DFS34DRAFT_613207 [Phlyctochytrium arcticum]